MKNGYVLGIDTSNYKTSIALVGTEGVIYDNRRFLEVKDGKLGLRQSEALFQHIKNLPEMFEEMGEQPICAVSYSSKPRPIEGSYMPCFLAGECLAKSFASLSDIPVFAYSHQEGHIEAAKYGLAIGNKFIACHFSGGTCEVLLVDNKEIKIIGGSKDISFGQVLDRLGIESGLSFPCGEELDNIALSAKNANVNHEILRHYEKSISPIKVKASEINLSGFETQTKRLLEKSMGSNQQSEIPVELIKVVFDRISDAIEQMLIQAYRISGIDMILLSGGVASSKYIRKQILEDFITSEAKLQIHFGRSDLSSDNAVGIALLGLNESEI